MYILKKPSTGCIRKRITPVDLGNLIFKMDFIGFRKPDVTMDRFKGFIRNIN